MFFLYTNKCFRAMPQMWLSLFKVDQLVKNKLTGDTEKTNQKKKNYPLE